MENKKCEKCGGKTLKDEHCNCVACMCNCKNSPSPKEGEADFYTKSPLSTKKELDEENEKMNRHIGNSPVSSAEEIRKEFTEKFGMKEFIKPTFVKHGTYCNEIANFFLSHRTSEFQSLVEKIEGMKHGLGSGDGYLIDRGYNQAVQEIINLIHQEYL